VWFDIKVHMFILRTFPSRRNLISAFVLCQFEPISHKALRDAVQLLFDSLQACMDGNDLPPACTFVCMGVQHRYSVADSLSLSLCVLITSVGFASWTEVWWANSPQRLRIGWRESDNLVAGVDIVQRLEPLPQDPEAAFQIVSADQGMVLRDVDGKVYRLASKAVLDFVLSQESNPT
jgi:hypothetical protein